MEKEAEQRTDKDNQELLPLVLEFPFIRDYIDKFNECEFKQVANALELKKYPKDRRIFNAGEKSDEFFVIIRGQVGVLYPKQKVYDYQAEGNFEKKVVGMRKKYVEQAVEEQIFITKKEQTEEEVKKEKKSDENPEMKEWKRKQKENNEMLKHFEMMVNLNQETNKNLEESRQMNPLYAY